MATRVPTTETTDRRERVIAAIDQWFEETGSDILADAVLAALEPDLLPELPEGWSFDRAFEESGAVRVYLVRGQGIGTDNWRYGTGPNLPAAIRDALE